VARIEEGKAKVELVDVGESNPFFSLREVKIVSS